MAAAVDEWIYGGVVIAAGVTLLIEANRNFSRVGLNDSFAAFPILRDAKVSDLCSGREWIGGYLVYSLLYLIAYIVLLSWATLFELVSQAEFARGQLGATGGILNPVTDPFNLSSLGYGKPIFISALLISVFSINAMRPVEETLRGLAQRLAGIPHGIFRVIQDLSGIRWRTFLSDAEATRQGLLKQPRTRKGLFRAKLKGPPVSTIPITTEVPTPLLSAFHEAMETWPDSLRARIRDRVDLDQAMDGLYAVDFLSPAVTGALSQLYFPAQKLAKVEALVRSFGEEREALRQEIRSLSQPKKTVSADEFEHAVADFQDRALLLKNSAAALFSVLYIRNNRSIKETREGDPYGVLQRHIQGEYSVEHNSFAMAVFGAAVIAFFVNLAAMIGATYSLPVSSMRSLMDPNIAQAVSDPRQTPAERQETWSNICTLLHDQGTAGAIPVECDGAWVAGTGDSEAVKLVYSNGTLQAPGQEAFALLPPRPQTVVACDALHRVRPSTIDAAAQGGAACAAYIKEARRNVVWDRLGNYSRTSIWVVAKWGVGIMMSVSAALLVWEMRRDANSWKPWTLRRFPFIRFLSISILPAILLFIGLSIVDFLQLWVNSGFSLSQASVINFVQVNGPYNGAMSLGGLILAFWALMMMDRHDSWSFTATFVFSLCGAFLFAGLTALVILMTYATGDFYHVEEVLFDRYLREVVRESAVVFCFLVLFGTLLESSEQHKDGIEDEQQEGWVAHLRKRAASIIPQRAG